MGKDGAADRNASEPVGDAGGERERTKMAPTTTRTTANAIVRRERVFMTRARRGAGVQRRGRDAVALPGSSAILLLCIFSLRRDMPPGPGIHVSAHGRVRSG